ncbi:hypothetical protein [uncultured Ferrimonas sp.]|uniref:hypothetical protein n=1 Tax=uncultured Ferrimonas sp. TaxID=432640 RepID=UPI00260D8B70|nr:hypothetical protein [uncultured Ferrimonas sp.]
MALSFTKIFKKSEQQEPASELVLNEQVNEKVAETEAKAAAKTEQEKPVSCCGHCS